MDRCFEFLMIIYVLGELEKLWKTLKNDNAKLAEERRKRTKLAKKLARVVRRAI